MKPLASGLLHDSPSEGSQSSTQERSARQPFIWGWKLTALATSTVLAGLTILGVMAVPFHDSADNWLRWFDLDRELNVVVAFSAALLVANGFLVWKAVQMGKFHVSARILGAIFVFMALDESLKVHETLEKVIGINWQILYLPVLFFAGLGWLYVWLRSRGLTRFLWMAGAGCWFLSQAFEFIQWGGLSGSDKKIASYNALMVVEEVLEMLGSLLFLLALFRIAWPKGIRLEPAGTASVPNL